MRCPMIRVPNPGRKAPEPRRSLRLLLCAGLCALGPAAPEKTAFEEALERGRRALSMGQLEAARAEMIRALERDPRSPEAWTLRAEVAAAAGDADEQVFALHRRFALRVAQKARRGELDELRKELSSLDAIAPDLFDLKVAYVERLLPLAEACEKEKRPHSAIRVHQLLLALDPEREESRAAIERISAAPDPSLAETARARDLFEGVSEEWMRKFDAEHASWDRPGLLERENYVTRTDAGYAVMARAAEAMEQMNAFYREFFRYGTADDGRSVPRIELHIFKSRDEYLKLGSGPPAEWSGGQFTGSAVETYVGPGGFEETVTTLFHEAAHQFVGLATRAVGWLNEGLASFFEGSRILANGTVLTNMPANHRLFPLAQRMERGWMSGPADGIDPQGGGEPEKAPTFRIVLENRYAWGPPWYAPTWGVVYFLYNHQDPADGRFVYRRAFREFVDKSGGRSGEGAVENFEQVVLAHPEPPTKGVDFSNVDDPVRLAGSIDELNEVWKDYVLKLRDEQSGRAAPDRPYLDWARHALARKDLEVAREHFEKGLVAEPDHVELLLDFARFLRDRGRNADRAAKLALRALQILEQPDAAGKVDEAIVKEADKLLSALDPRRTTLDRILEQLEGSVRSIAERYLAAARPTMAMEVSQRFATELGMPSLFEVFEAAAKQSGRTLSLWQLAYNENNLDGWMDAGNDAFHASGAEIVSSFGDVKEGRYDYQFLLYDTVTSGDYSFEAELLADSGALSFAGLVFGKKAASTFHALVHYPGRAADPRYDVAGRQAAVDLASFYSFSDFKIWRHNVLPGADSGWRRLRVDVVGRTVDVWCDGELVVSQDFPSLDVLRGSFGLLTGPGQARWRNVRYLARSARDPGALIEREVTMQRLKEEAARAGRPIGSSFVGLVPPFPAAANWVTDAPDGFEAAGSVPQLLVFFSIRQNEKLPIHGWLAEMVKKHEDVGLRAICIASPDDLQLEEYLRTHPFPGAVGHDERRRGGESYGVTFEQYFIPRFELPRVLLLDVDQRVAWEGPPGFEIGKPWAPGAESYLDAPLQELIARRHLRGIRPWLKAWEQGGELAFRAGDLAAALPLLEQAEALTGALEPTLLDVQQKLKILRAALAGIEATAQQLARAGGEAALPVLFEWAALLEQRVPEDAQRSARRSADTPAAKSWTALVERGRAVKKQVLGSAGLSAVRPFIDELAAGPAPLAPLYADQLNAVLASGDPAAVAKLLDSAAASIPARWLARSFFGW
jgi:tetratricopeptide (TPR) repeat protein